jgi:hypothetical protein
MTGSGGESWHFRLSWFVLGILLAFTWAGVDDGQNHVRLLYGTRSVSAILYKENYVQKIQPSGSLTAIGIVSCVVTLRGT